MRNTPDKEKVLLLALSDDYWTPFVFDMAELLKRHGIEAIIATDCRAGEYQTFGGRKEAPCKTYYYSDYINDPRNRTDNPKQADIVESDALFSDYYRLYTYGAHKHLLRTPWSQLRKSLQSFFEHIFNHENIGIVLHDQVSTSFSYSCYMVAKSRNADYFGIVGARIPDRYEIRKTIINEDLAVKKIYQEIISGQKPLTTEERHWAQEFLGNIENQEPSYMKGNPLCEVRFSTYINQRKLISFLRKIKYELMETSDKSNYSFREGPFASSVRSFKRNIARLVKKRSFASYDQGLDDSWLSQNKYWVYPIHFQPEASTSVGSPYFVDQFNFIRNVAFSLPNETYLLVKEHKSAIGAHNKNFYRDLAALPNVILIGHEWNIKQLIRKSLGVITLTSTAAFEALLLNKQVYMFGDAFFSFHPLCTKMDSWHELKTLLHNNKDTPKSNISENFLVAYRRYTRPGIITYSKKAWGIGEDLASTLSLSIENRK